MSSPTNKLGDWLNEMYLSSASEWSEEEQRRGGGRKVVQSMRCVKSCSVGALGPVVSQLPHTCGIRRAVPWWLATRWTSTLPHYCTPNSECFTIRLVSYITPRKPRTYVGPLPHHPILINVSATLSFIVSVVVVSYEWDIARAPSHGRAQNIELQDSHILKVTATT